MAKGDYILVKQEIGGQLVEDRITVEHNGGALDIIRDKRDGTLEVEVLNKNGRPTGRKHTFVGASIRSIAENLSRE